jgi:hypothetical protein
MHTSKASEKYLFASFDNLDLRSFSSHMIVSFGLNHHFQHIDHMTDLKELIHEMI